MSKIAIIGSGISGLGAAWFLRRDHEVVIYEADSHAGGHAHTVDVDADGRRIPVDTGFMVFNRVTYPLLTRLFETLEVPVKRTDMSFSVQHRSRGLEYSGTSLNHLFAQRRNLLRPSYYRMLWQIDRFNREAVQALQIPSTECLSLEEYVRLRRYGEDFFNLYLLPMSSAVWSTPPEKMLQFPAATLLRFFHNHGFLGLHTQHPWWTIEGGSRVYVEKLLQQFTGRVLLNSPVRKLHRLPNHSVEVISNHGVETFDKVILACHPPQSLMLLGDGATAEEHRLLARFKYQSNRVTLHTDEKVMPKTRLAWSSWNYRLEGSGKTKARDDSLGLGAVSTHYWMNSLQFPSVSENHFVSVEGEHLVAPDRRLFQCEKEHPLFDRCAIDGQDGITQLNRDARGTTETYFAGAWHRYGFHEDGLLSALNVSREILARDPWQSGSPVTVS
jgi:predicted NAD/FAD-binding protein